MKTTTNHPEFELFSEVFGDFRPCFRQADLSSGDLGIWESLRKDHNPEMVVKQSNQKAVPSIKWIEKVNHILEVPVLQAIHKECVRLALPMDKYELARLTTVVLATVADKMFNSDLLHTPPAAPASAVTPTKAVSRSEDESNFEDFGDSEDDYDPSPTPKKKGALPKKAPTVGAASKQPVASNLPNKTSKPSIMTKASNKPGSKPASKPAGSKKRALRMTEDEEWSANFDQLLSWETSHGTFNVPKGQIVLSDGIAFQLGDWLAKQHTLVHKYLNDAPERYDMLTTLMERGLWTESDALGADRKQPLQLHREPSGAKLLLPKDPLPTDETESEDEQVVKKPRTGLFANHPPRPFAQHPEARQSSNSISDSEESDDKAMSKTYKARSCRKDSDERHRVDSARMAMDVEDMRDDDNWDRNDHKNNHKDRMDRDAQAKVSRDAGRPSAKDTDNLWSQSYMKRGQFVAYRHGSAVSIGMVTKEMVQHGQHGRQVFEVQAMRPHGMTADCKFSLQQNKVQINVNDVVACDLVFDDGTFGRLVKKSRDLLEGVLKFVKLPIT